MSSRSFLPSEISRLVYGYLENDCNEDLALTFLNTCESLKECRGQVDVGFDSKFQSLFSLTQILNQYAALSTLIFENVGADVKCTHLNIVPSLRKLLQCRLGHPAETYRTRETRRISSSNKKSETAIKMGENTTKNDVEVTDNDSRIRGEYSTPVKGVQSISAGIIAGTATLQEQLSQKRLSTENSLVWDHSVQSILAAYSPQIGQRSSRVHERNETPCKKRKLEDTEREVNETRVDLRTRGKRSTLSPKSK